MRARAALWLAAVAACAPPPARLVATPDDYQALASDLRAGQTLELTPGVYRDCLALMGLRGRPDAPIVIRGPARGPRPLFLGAGCAQVALRRSAVVLIEDSRWVTLERLELDGQGARVSGVRAGFGDTPVVGLTLSQLDLHDFDASPQFSAISSFATAWDWRIIGNHITRVGLGMYLGNSNGAAPFIRGEVRGNVVLDPLGYGIQIKHQAPRRPVAGMPPDGSVTRVVGNLIRKAARGLGGEEGRPNLLLGAQPPEGPGRSDRYEVSHNLLLQNDAGDEPLLQGEGNLDVHHNVLLNDFGGGGVLIRPHQGGVGEITVRENTIIARGVGISVEGSVDPVVRDNAVYALGPCAIVSPRGFIGAVGGWPDGPRWAPARWEDPQGPAGSVTEWAFGAPLWDP